jgi:hypothetical protein
MEGTWRRERSGREEELSQKILMCTMASEMTYINSVKTDHDIATILANLPNGILEHTASFLAAPPGQRLQAALFAAALSTNHPPSDNHTSIVGADDWDTLDFGEIEEDLAAKLSDDDISAVLVHIDGVNKLKRLRLTNCTNITGIGLRPLLFSTTIEQIDLSLVGDGKSPVIDPEPPISCEAVLPILHSIIMTEGCSLKHLELPYKWRKDTSTDSEFHAFVNIYNGMRGDRDNLSCLNCNEDLPTDVDWMTTQPFDGNYGLHHNHTCCRCTMQYCYKCNLSIDQCNSCGSRHCHNEAYFLRTCKVCQRDYCKECVNVDLCPGCREFVCELCVALTFPRICSECDQVAKDGFNWKCEIEW